MTPISPSNDRGNAAGEQVLNDSIHALAQPLTALLFLLELGARHNDPRDLQTTIDDARTECLRAIKALEGVRNAAHALGTMENNHESLNADTGTAA